MKISKDTSSGELLAQMQMFNLSDRLVKSVCCDVDCCDAAGLRLFPIRDVYLQDVNAAAHSLFGDDRVLSLPAPKTVQLHVLVRKVVFFDGMVWEQEGHIDLQTAPPEKVDRQSAAWQKMQALTAGTNIRTDYWFEQREHLWYCTCGQLNDNSVGACAACHAERSWLQTHLSAQALAEQALPEQQKKSAETPEAKTSWTGEGHNTNAYLERMIPLLEGAFMAQQEQAPASQAPAQDSQDQPASPFEQYLMQKTIDEEAQRAQEKKRKKRRGIVLIVLLVLALAVGGYFGYTYYLQPLQQYKQALTMRADGDYAGAEAAFQALAGRNFRDAQAQYEQTVYEQALSAMEQGNYEEAYDLFASVKGYDDSEERMVQCQYEQAAALVNRGDYETALEQLLALQSSCGDYNDTQALIDQCRYELACQTYQDEDYEAAKALFQQCINYLDAAEWVEECDYQLGLSLMAGGSYEEAASLFSGLNTADSEDKTLEAMYAYVKANLDRDNETTMSYLETLRKEKYSDSQKLYDELMSWKVKLFFNAKESDLTTEKTSFARAETIYVHYLVSGGPENGELRLRLDYVMPDGTTGSKTVSTLCEDGTAGSIFWEGGVYTDPRTGKTGTMTVKAYDAESNSTVPLATATVKITE